MAITYAKLKNGEELSGPINLFRPALGWFTLFGLARKIKFDDCLSVLTPNERVNEHSPPEGELCDEMERARKILRDGRNYGWTETNEDMVEEPYPKEKWEPYPKEKWEPYPKEKWEFEK